MVFQLTIIWTGKDVFWISVNDSLRRNEETKKRIDREIERGTSIPVYQYTSIRTQYEYTVYAGTPVN